MKLIIDDLSVEQRLDVYLTDYLQEFSRSKLQAAIKDAKILVNSKNVKPSYTIKSGDIIELDIAQNNTISIEPEDIPIDILYDDNNMAVVNKPSGMLTHPTSKEKTELWLMHFCINLAIIFLT